jgi:signal transduction histidine kinase
MDEHHETWQKRIQALYANVDELYSHLDVTVVVFDRNLVAVSSGTDNALLARLVELARRVRDTGQPHVNVALDQVGRQRVHCYPMRDRDMTVGVSCIVVDDEARRELFVRCAMAIFDGYRVHEAQLLQRERQAREEAQRANQQRDQFLAVVAHELRTPMASILLWEQVLRDPSLDASTRESALAAIHDSAAGQSLLIADLLDVSRAINGKLHIERRATPMLPILVNAIEDARRRARHLTVTSHVDPALGHVDGDVRRLRQIFENLISNAIKCTDHGEIIVRAQQDDEYLMVEVSDTGRGIFPGLLPHLFEPFWQGEYATVNDGLGLGLSIVRQLVELHGGSVTASSNGVGHGARFSVRLPRIASSSPLVTSSTSSLAGIRVLVVDDDALLVQALQHLLRRVGAIVTTATSARSAFAVLERGKTDILVSDIGMPEEDGESLVRRMRATQAMQSLPTIAITARLTESSRDQSLSAGFDRYLTKPINVALLVSSILELTR